MMMSDQPLWNTWGWGSLRCVYISPRHRAPRTNHLQSGHHDFNDMFKLMIMMIVIMTTKIKTLDTRHRALRTNHLQSGYHDFNYMFMMMIIMIMTMTMTTSKTIIMMSKTIIMKSTTMIMMSTMMLPPRHHRTHPQQSLQQGQVRRDPRLLGSNLDPLLMLMVLEQPEMVITRWWNVPLTDL